jgi:hypothetical protein
LVSVPPAITPEHVPTLPGKLQVEHTVSHLVSQQTPSAQFPEPHSVPAPQFSPLALRPDWHVPLASQYCAPAHICEALGSCPPGGTLTQLPSLPGTLQAWQVLVQVLLQQYPSTQLAEPQSLLPFGHIAPFGFLFDRQLPALQYCIVPSQVLGEAL